MSARISTIDEWRSRLAELVESERFKNAIMTLIGFNALTLGLESSRSIMAEYGDLLHAVDRIVLAIFVVELAARLFAHGPRFFRDGWNVFDFAVVLIALAPQSGPLSVLRALRILRVFRLVSAVPSMRVVVEALLKSLPGLSAIIALLVLVFYVFAVMATKLFGETNPDKFGSLGQSLFTLFQLMTLEGWTTDIVNPVLEHHPFAMLYFLPFMLLSTFTVLNLFIALIVDSMQKLGRGPEAETAANAREERIEAELRALTEEIRRLREGAR